MDALLRWVLTLCAIVATMASPVLSSPPITFDRFCFECHHAGQSEGELDLKALLSKPPEAGHVSLLDEIVVRIEEHDMPPQDGALQPSQDQRDAMVTWIKDRTDILAQQTANDPGAVVMARLTRNEYRNVLRDLSGGVVLKAGNYLPNEGGAGEGFANVGEAQGMTVAQFEKYLEAAKEALKHLRVSPRDGLVWSDTPREPVESIEAAIKEAVDDIIAWYVSQQQKWGAVHREELNQSHTSAHAVYLEAAWRRVHQRNPLDINLAPVALEKWIRILSDEQNSTPLAEWGQAWRAIPETTSDEQLRTQCRAIVNGQATDASQLNAVEKHYAPAYEISFREAEEEVLAAARDEGRWPFRIDIGDAKELFLIMTDAGDGAAGEFGLWNQGRFIFKDGTSKPWHEVVKIIGANSGREFRWGNDGANQATLEPDAVGQKPPGALKFAVPENAIVFEVDFRLDKNRTRIASVQSLVLKEKPKSQSFVPGRYVFGGRELSNSKDTATSDRNKKRDQLLRKRNVAEALETKVGLNAERNLFADWTRTRIEAIGGPWPSHKEESPEPDAPYFYTVPEIRRNATVDDRSRLRTLEDRLEWLVQPPSVEVVESNVRIWLVGFATKAWRRPLSDQESEQLVQLFRESAAQRTSFDTAMKASLLAILVSPHFLYKTDLRSVANEESSSTSAVQLSIHKESEPLTHGEGQLNFGTGEKVLRALTQRELASRLSFFLWASLPDDQLLESDLTKPDVMNEQVRRMLRDERARSLAIDFGSQVWGFQDFETYSGPDAIRFPEFTSARRLEMIQEVLDALDRVFIHDEPITRLLNEDCLATKPLFLTKTSLPLRTSPVQRGAWVIETLLGRRLPPPPVNVPKLSEDEKNQDGLNIRQQLAQHRSDPACAACHSKIDPPGVALENFDPIGRWRDQDRDGSPIVKSDLLRDGTELDGPDGLKRWLLSREDEFVTNFCRKLVGYALGRSLLPGDRLLINRMRKHRIFSAAVLELVASPQFLYRSDSP